MHRTLRVFGLLGMVLILSACQSAPVAEVGEQDCAQTASGNSSDAVVVSGAFPDTPTVDFAGTLSPERTERTLAEAGDGRVAKAGSLVTFAYAAFNASTGEVIDAVGYETPYTQAAVDDTSMLLGLEKVIVCGKPGSRITAVVPPGDAFGTDGNEQFGIAPDDSIVFVIDIIAVAADRAEGESQPPIDGLPVVTVGATGEPEIAIPPRNPTVKLKVAVLKKGAGAEVTAGSTVTVEYRGVVWDSNQTFDSSWRRDDLVQLPTTSFIPGFEDALLGQTVGSQVLAIVPPKLGYGADGNPSAGISGTDTLVFVIDILAVVRPLGTSTAPIE